MFKYITLSLSVIAFVVATSVSNRILSDWDTYVSVYAWNSTLTPQFTLAFVWLVPVLLLIASILAIRSAKDD